MRFTSPSRRAAGLLAATTIGLSTAVLSVTGVASAAPLAPITSDDDYYASTADDDSSIAIGPGYCQAYIQVVGGQGGSNGVSDGLPAGEVSLLAAVTAGQTFTFAPGSAATGTPPGSNAGQPSYAGAAGTGTGGGGGAGSALILDGSGVVVAAQGGNGAGDGEANPGGDGGGIPNYYDPSLPADQGNAPFTGPTNAAGGSSWTSDGVVYMGVIGCDAPYAPSVDQVVAGDTTATVDFFPSSVDDRRAPVSSYEYSLDGVTWETANSRPIDSGSTDPAAKRTFTISSLTNGQSYTVQLRALSTDNGTSAVSQPSASFTPMHYVDAPASATLTPGVGSVTFSWTAPADAAGVAGYEMRAYPNYDGDPEAPDAPKYATCEVAVGTMSCVVAATPGFVYNGYVAAVDANGYSGQPTDASSTTPVTAAKAPASVPAASAPLTSNDADGALKAGQQVTLSGSGYLPGSTVELTVYSTPVSLGSAVVASDGTFSATVTIPADLVNGTHHLVASGVDANGNTRYLVVEVTVSGGTAVVTGTTTASGLAYTGFTALPFVGAGLLALLAGAGLLVASRRRAS